MFAEVRYLRDHLVFLKQFVRSITQPVRHDGREHMEYVPSQIVTEYFRHRYSSDGNARLDGIVYRSAQRKSGRSAVVFASQDDLNPCPDYWTMKDRTTLLTLCPKSMRRLRPTRKH
jgi:hypothetical protein